MSEDRRLEQAAAHALTAARLLREVADDYARRAGREQLSTEERATWINHGEAADRLAAIAGDLPQPAPVPTPAERAQQLREWQARLAGHLGWDIGQVLRVEDKPYLREGWGGITQTVGRIVSYEATDPQPTRIGMQGDRTWYADGDVDSVPMHKGRVYLNPEEWEEIIAEIGAKPPLFSDADELAMLRLQHGRPGS